MKEKVGLLIKTGEQVKVSKSGKRRKFILCKCECGNNHSVDMCHWKNEKTKSCGCEKYKSLIGISFGKLTVISESEKRRLNSTGEKYWKCKCFCGNVCLVATTDLKRKNKKGTESCGCLIGKSSFEESRLKRIFSRYKTQSKRRKKEFHLDIEDVKNLINNPCFYCGTRKANKIELPKRVGKEPIYAEYMGIDRKNSSMNYTKENCVPCCYKCNTMKNRMTFSEYLKKLKK